MTDRLMRLPAGLAHPGNMLPPPLPTRGPNIDIPSALACSQSSASCSVPSGLVLIQSQLPASLPFPPNSGYGVQHLQYAAQRDHWARIAHCPPPAEAISLEISVLYENGSKRKGTRGTPLGVSIFFFVYLCSSLIRSDVVLRVYVKGSKTFQQ